MSVNTMSIEQGYQLLTSLHQQATGNNLVVTDLSSFISVAHKTLATGYDSVLNAITQVIGKTLVAVRPYNRKFSGLEMSNERWGGVIRKLSFGDRDPIDDPTYALNEGGTVDQYTIRKPDVLETRYTGSVVYEGSYTIFTKQLDTAFSDPAEFAAFMSGLMTHFSNEREQWLEDLSRAIVCNMIAARQEIGNECFIPLITTYNQMTGQSETVISIQQPDKFDHFAKWVYAYVNNISNLMAQRSGLFQMSTGKNINRHTPVEDQRIYFNADFLSHITSQVLADTYHDNFLTLADVEPVAFWQSITDPLSVYVKPVYIDSTGTIVVPAGSPVPIAPVLGIMFDRDAMGYNIYDDSIEMSPYNAKGQYYNIFSHMRIQLQNDMTEKAAVFTLS